MNLLGEFDYKIGDNNYKCRLNLRTAHRVQLALGLQGLAELVVRCQICCLDTMITLLVEGTENLDLTKDELLDQEFLPILAFKKFTVEQLEYITSGKITPTQEH